MSGRLAILCPGQGAQHAGMFDLARADARVSRLLDVWLDGWLVDAGLNMPLDAILQDRELLYSNRIAQPLIVAAALAMWEALRDMMPPPVLAAGYSIGELAAYGVAASLTPPEAIRLARMRATLMDECAGQGPAASPRQPRQSMIAVSGLSVRLAGELLRPQGFHVAIDTGEDSAIAGGPSGARAAAEDSILRAGGRVTVLPVEVASHTPLMQAAVAPLEDLLRNSAFADPAFPVLSGIGAEPVHCAGRAITALARQVAQTIRWKDCMDACAEAGITVALELGPGAALSRMLQARHPGIECRSVADFRTLDGIGKWLARRLG